MFPNDKKSFMSYDENNFESLNSLNFKKTSEDSKKAAEEEKFKGYLIKGFSIIHRFFNCFQFLALHKITKCNGNRNVPILI